MTVPGRPGPVLEPVELDDTLGVPRELARSPDTFALRVRGESMIGEQLRDGDLVLAQWSPAAREGDTVVAIVRDAAVVRRFHRQDGKVLLRSADEGLAPLVVDEEDVEVRGVVVAVVRKY